MTSPVFEEKRNVMGMMPHPERAADAYWADRWESDTRTMIIRCRLPPHERLTSSELDKVGRS